MRRMPALTSEWLSRCYVVCSVLVASRDGDDAELGRKLKLLIPRMVMCPLGGLTSGKASAEFRRRCRLFVNGGWRELMDTAPPPLTAEMRAEAEAEAALRRGWHTDAKWEHSVYAVECQRPGKGLGGLLSAGIATGRFVWDKLLDLHFLPMGEDPAFAADSDPAELNPAEEAEYQRLRRAELDPGYMSRVKDAIAKHVRTLPMGVGPGPDGERYEHIRAVAGTEVGLQSLVDLNCELVQGRWHPGDRASRLTALKKDDSADPVTEPIRPIASGTSTRRTSGTSLIDVDRDRIEAVLLPVHQMSFTTDGCLVMYNLARHSLAVEPGWVIANGDESSAFQHVSRPQMRRQLMAHLPEYIPYFAGAYDAPAGLHYTDSDGVVHTVPEDKSKHGCQQGCSMGTLLFGLARKPMLQGLRERHRECMIISISDDIYIFGPPATVAACWEDWRDKVAESGGVVNVGKCGVWSPTAEGTSHPDIQALAGERGDDGVVRGGFDVLPRDGTRGGMRLGGHPLGCDEFCRAFYDGRAAETERVVSSIKDLVNYDNPVSIQSAYLMLRFCAEPKFAHLLRGAPPDLVRDAASRHDRAISDGMNAILGPSDLLWLSPEAASLDWQSTFRKFGHVPPSDEVLCEIARVAREQTALPLRRGGAGLVRATDVSAAAFLGGLARTARFFARERVSEPDSDGECYGFGITGAAFAAALQSEAFPHCVAAREAWEECSVLVEARSNVGADITALAKCSGRSELHVAEVRLQTLLSREMAEGRSRELQSSCVDIGVDPRHPDLPEFEGGEEVDRLRSTTARGATGFMRSFPTGGWHRMQNVDIRIIFQHYFGTLVPELANAPAHCPCLSNGNDRLSNIADLRGRHDMRCLSGSFIHRHNEVLRAIQSTLRLIGLASSMDTVLVNARARLPNGAPDPGDVSKQQPDLAVHETHTGGARATLHDAVITDPTTHNNRSLRAAIGRAADNKEQIKVRKYRAQAARNHYLFHAFGLETFGAWGPMAQKSLARWSGYAVEAGRADTRGSQGWSAPHFQETMRQRVSVALQLGNARIIRAAAAMRNFSRRGGQQRAAAMHGDGTEDTACDHVSRSDSEPVARRPRNLSHAQLAARVARDQAVQSAGRPDRARAVAARDQDVQARADGIPQRIRRQRAAAEVAAAEHRRQRAAAPAAPAAAAAPAASAAPALAAVGPAAAGAVVWRRRGGDGASDGVASAMPAPAAGDGAPGDAAMSALRQAATARRVAHGVPDGASRESVAGWVRVLAGWRISAAPRAPLSDEACADRALRWRDGHPQGVAEYNLTRRVARDTCRSVHAALHAAGDATHSIVDWVSTGTNVRDVVRTAAECVGGGLEFNSDGWENAMVGQIRSDIVARACLTPAAPAAREAILASEPMPPVDVEDRCLICQAPLVETVDAGVQLGPSLRWPGCVVPHLFHRECLREYLGSRARCPTCRREVPSAGPHVGAVSTEFDDSDRPAATRWQPLPTGPWAEALIRGHVSRLRDWLSADDTVLFGNAEGRRGASSLFVPLVHHGLRRCGHELPEAIALSTTWGGAMVEEACRLLFASVGRGNDWAEACAAAQASIAARGRGDVDTMVARAMGAGGYIGWAEQQYLLGAGGDVDAEVEYAVDLHGQPILSDAGAQEDASLSGAAAHAILLATGARHELRSRRTGRPPAPPVVREAAEQAVARARSLALPPGAAGPGAPVSPSAGDQADGPEECRSGDTPPAVAASPSVGGASSPAAPSSGGASSQSAPSPSAGAAATTSSALAAGGGGGAGAPSAPAASSPGGAAAPSSASSSSAAAAYSAAPSSAAPTSTNPGHGRRHQFTNPERISDDIVDPARRGRVEGGGGAAGGGGAVGEGDGSDAEDGGSGGATASSPVSPGRWSPSASGSGASDDDDDDDGGGSVAARVARRRRCVLSPASRT